MAQRGREVARRGRKLALLAAGATALATAVATGTLLSAPNALAANSVDGYATVNGSTTGGAGGSTVTVTSASALASAAGSSTKETVLVNGNFSCSTEIKVASNKTIQGVGSNSGLTGCGLNLK